MPKGLWADPGPDSGWGWVIAVAACWITFTAFGVSRASGVLFVAVVETYGVNRQEAAWPFSLAPTVASFTAIFSALLFRFMDARKGLSVGFLIATIGVGVCYFANSVLWFIVGFGICFGFGIALALPMLTAILNEYFLKKRATANGIYLAGSTLGLFAAPPLLESLLEMYGLRGTMLLASGFVLHAFIGVALLRPRTAAQFPVLKEPSREQFLKDIVTKRPSVVLDASLTDIRLTKPESYWQVLRSILTNPLFYLIVLSSLACITPLLALGMIVTDFGIDKGLSKERAVLLLSAGSLPELAGRLCLGWLADKKFIKYKNLYMIVKLLAGTAMVVLPFVNGEPLLFTIVAINGLLEGCSVVLLNVLYVEYLGLDKMPVAFSWCLFLNGFVFLSLPFLIGFFRDQGGSYLYLFFSLGLLSATSALAWVLEPFLVKREQRLKQISERTTTA